MITPARREAKPPTVWIRRMGKTSDFQGKLKQLLSLPRTTRQSLPTLHKIIMHPSLWNKAKILSFFLPKRKDLVIMI